MLVVLPSNTIVAPPIAGAPGCTREDTEEGKALGSTMKLDTLKEEYSSGKARHDKISVCMVRWDV